jgi:hypothetical protein
MKVLTLLTFLLIPLLLSGCVQFAKLQEVTFNPKVGEYLHSRNSDKIHDCRLGKIESKILLVSSTLSYGKLKANQTTGPPVCSVTAEEGDSVVMIRGKIKNEYDRDYYVAISADIYNAKGEKVGQIVDPPVCIASIVFVRSNQTANFAIHVKYDKRDIKHYELFAFVCSMPPP